MTDNRNSARALAEAGIALLAERWPLCFHIHPRDRKPLKLGIHTDILAAGVLSEKDLAAAMRWYVGALPYRRKCVEGAARIGLDGEPTGTVSAEHAAEQKRTVKTIVAALAAKPKAKRDTEKAAQPAAKAIPQVAKTPPVAAPVPAPPAPVQRVVVEVRGRRPVLSLPRFRKSA
jgi:sRNA-binding protein